MSNTNILDKLIEYYERDTIEFYYNSININKKFVDDNFPCNDYSIIGIDKKLFFDLTVSNINSYIWKSINDIKVSGSIFPSKINVYKIKSNNDIINKNFISGVQFVSENIQLLRRLFLDITISNIYGIWLFSEKNWRLYIIDPCVPLRNDNICYSYYEDNYQFIPLIEKALAKSKGCYNNISKYTTIELINDLLGIIPIYINISQIKDHKKLLKYNNKDDYLMGIINIKYPNEIYYIKEFIYENNNFTLKLRNWDNFHIFKNFNIYKDSIKIDIRIIKEYFDYIVIYELNINYYKNCYKFVNNEKNISRFKVKYNKTNVILNLYKDVFNYSQLNYGINYQLNNNLSNNNVRSRVKDETVNSNNLFPSLLYIFKVKKNYMKIIYFDKFIYYSKKVNLSLNEGNYFLLIESQINYNILNTVSISYLCDKLVDYTPIANYNYFTKIKNFFINKVISRKIYLNKDNININNNCDNIIIKYYYINSINLFIINISNKSNNNIKIYLKNNTTNNTFPKTSKNKIIKIYISKEESNNIVIYNTTNLANMSKNIIIKNIYFKNNNIKNKSFTIESLLNIKKIFKNNNNYLYNDKLSNNNNFCNICGVY